MMEKADPAQNLFTIMRLWEFSDQYVIEPTDGSSVLCMAISRVDASMNLIDEMPHCSTLCVPKIQTIFGVVGMLKLGADDCSRYTWIHLMKNKSETRAVIKNFHKQMQTQYGMVIKILRSDNGLEFKMTDFFAENGIVHHTCVHTPQQNSVVERKHHHVLSVARAL